MNYLVLTRSLNKAFYQGVVLVESIVIDGGEHRGYMRKEVPKRQ